jgi:hypothetical protein
MPDKFQIQLKVADKYYPLECKRNVEERILRRAASKVNNYLPKYEKEYAKEDYEQKDLLALVALHISLENLTIKKNEDITPLFNKIGQLNKELETCLSENKK